MSREIVAHFDGMRQVIEEHYKENQRWFELPDRIQDFYRDEILLRFIDRILVIINAGTLELRKESWKDILTWCYLAFSVLEAPVGQLPDLSKQSDMFWDSLNTRLSKIDPSRHPTDLWRKLPINGQTSRMLKRMFDYLEMVEKKEGAPETIALRMAGNAYICLYRYYYPEYSLDSDWHEW